MQHAAWRATIVGGILGLLVAPFVALASAAEYRAVEGLPAKPPPALLSPLLSFSTPSKVYGAYGSVWIPVALLLLGGAWALRARTRAALGRRGRVGFDFLLFGLALTVPANLLDYVLGRLDTSWASAVSAVGFAFFTVPAVILYMVGSVLSGIDVRRTSAAPPPVAWALIAAPLAIPATLLLSNAPAGPMALFSLTWLIIGITMLRSPSP